jgi:hypothetical protein
LFPEKCRLGLVDEAQNLAGLQNNVCRFYFLNDLLLHADLEICQLIFWLQVILDIHFMFEDDFISGFGFRGRFKQFFFF